MIKKIAQGLKRVIKAGRTDEEFLEYLEELLIEGDFGVSVAGDVVSEFTNTNSKKKEHMSFNALISCRILFCQTYI